MNAFANMGLKAKDVDPQPELVGESKPPVEVTEADLDFAHYTCHPLQRFVIGKFEFEQGALRLPLEEAEAFDAMMAKQPPLIQARVKKIDVEAANEVAAKLAAVRVRGTDTSGLSKEEQAEADANGPAD